MERSNNVRSKNVIPIATRQLFAMLGLMVVLPCARADVSVVEGTVYCSSSRSSLGSVAEIQVLSTLNHANDPANVHLNAGLLITAWPVPADTRCWVLSGPTAARTPFSGGTLCLGQPYSRIATDVATGDYFDVDFLLTDPALAHVPFAPGDWHFQVVFRDPPVRSGISLSEAMHVNMIPPL